MNSQQFAKSGNQFWLIDEKPRLENLVTQTHTHCCLNWWVPVISAFFSLSPTYQHTIDGDIISPLSPLISYSPPSHPPSSSSPPSHLPYPPPSSHHPPPLLVTCDNLVKLSQQTDIYTHQPSSTPTFIYPILTHSVLKRQCNGSNPFGPDIYILRYFRKWSLICWHIRVGKKNSAVLIYTPRS